MLYSERLSFRFDGEIKSFTERQKLKTVSTIKISFTRNFKETFLSGKEKATTRNIKITKGKISLVKASIQ